MFCLQVHLLLTTSGFDFSPGDARVLSGSEEGVWGWLAINYATGALQVSLTSAADVCGRRCKHK